MKSATPPPSLRNINVGADVQNHTNPKMDSQTHSVCADSDSNGNTSLGISLPGKLSILGKVNTFINPFNINLDFVLVHYI